MTKTKAKTQSIMKRSILTVALLLVASAATAQNSGPLEEILERLTAIEEALGGTGQDVAVLEDKMDELKSDVQEVADEVATVGNDVTEIDPRGTPTAIDFVRQLSADPAPSGETQVIFEATPGTMLLAGCTYQLLGDDGTNIRLETSADGVHWEHVAVVFGDDNYFKRSGTLLVKKIRFRNSGINTANDGIWAMQCSGAEIPTTF